MKVKYTCEKCGKNFTRRQPFKENQRTLCHGCSIKQYYIDHPEKGIERREKVEKTNLEKYGVKNISLSPEGKRKISAGLKENYKENKEKVLLKRNKTNLKLFGFEHAAQNPEILKKGLETQRANNNGLIGWENKEKQQKAEKLAHSEEANKKRIQTHLYKYNVETVLKNSENSNKLKGYIYKDIRFDSSWELAFYIYLTDQKKAFEYHPGFYFEYVDEKNKEHVCWPDFLVEGQFYEIKGDQFFNEKDEPYNKYTKTFWWSKYNALTRNNVKILRLEDMKKYLKYVKDTYGKHYLKSFKVK